MRNKKEKTRRSLASHAEVEGKDDFLWSAAATFFADLTHVSLKKHGAKKSPGIIPIKLINKMQINDKLRLLK